ncbi:MAG: Na+/H+ antiporter [Eggerthellaceae bacterium]|nr:Na+/H+ antiporter [Eggerthellaceae bacterium]
MEALELILLYFIAVLVSSIVDQLIPKVYSPLIQIILGLLIAVFAIAPISPSLDPELFLVLFIAPLLYDEARRANRIELWKNKAPVLALAIVLVFISTFVVGGIVHLLIPSIPLAAAFALGATLGPTDAVAVAALPKDIDIGKRQRSILKGESLINDASGIVAFQFAVAAVVTGTFSIADASLTFCVSFFGGLAIGIVLGFAANLIVKWVRSLGLDNTTFHVLIDVFLPFAVYLAAEAFSASGIIAVVAAGLTFSATKHDIGPAYSRTNIVSASVWKTVSFTLNGIVFVLLGTQLPKAMQSTWDDVSIGNLELFGYVIAITFAVVLFRFLWILAMEGIGVLRDDDQKKMNKENLRSALIMTLGGSKGAVTLAIAFTIPMYITAEQLFPQRELIIFLACGVILVTLLLSNFVLPLFAIKKDTTEDDIIEHEQDIEAHIDILRSVIEELTARQTPQNRRAVQSVVHQYNKRIARVKETHDIDDDVDLEDRMRAIGWQKEYVAQAIQDGTVSPKVGYKYLSELGRTEKRLERIDKSKLVNIQLSTSLFRPIAWMRNIISRYTIIKNTDEEEELLQLKIDAQSHTARRLHANISESEAPTEDASALWLLYQRSINRLRAAQNESTLPSPAKTRSKTLEMQRVAYELELDAIRAMREEERISPRYAKYLHSNVMLMMLDLEGTV